MRSEEFNAIPLTECNSRQLLLDSIHRHLSVVAPADRQCPSSPLGGRTCCQTVSIVTSRWSHLLSDSVHRHLSVVAPADRQCPSSPLGGRTCCQAVSIVTSRWSHLLTDSVHRHLSVVAPAVRQCPSSPLGGRTCCQTVSIVTSRWSHLSHIVHHSIEWCAGVYLSTVVFTQLRYANKRIVNITEMYKGTTCN